MATNPTPSASNNYGTFTPEQTANAADLAKLQNPVPTSTPVTNFAPAVTSAVITPAPISPESLQPKQSVVVPTYQPPAPAVTNNAADQILQQTQVEDTANQKLGSDISQKLYDAIGGLSGQTQALSDAQKAAGVDTKKQELQNLNSQILKLQAEIGQDDTTLIANSRAEENRDTLLPFAQMGQAKLAGDAAITRALKTSQIGVLNAQVLAKQGDIQLAIDTAKQAVDAKYAPYTEMIDIYTKQLAALQPLMDKDQKEQARQQELKTQLALQDLQDKKAKEKENLSLAFTSGLQNKFINKGGEIFRTSDGKAYNDPAEFLKDAGVSSFEEAYAKGLIGDLSANLIADRDFVSKAREQYKDAGILLTDTPAQAAAKIQNSALYQKDAYVDPYDSVYKNLQIQNLQNTLGQANAGQVNSANVDARVKQIIKANPGEYGNAAAQIDKEFGAGTATQYDSWLRRVYNYGQNIDDVTSGKPPTDAQQVSSGYANRMQDSDKIISDLQNNIKGMDYLSYQAQDKLPSQYQTETFRQYKQAVTNFITAKLRKESGASISPSEFEDAYRVYIPQPGDDKKTLANKARTREQVFKSMAAESGSAFQIPSSSQQPAIGAPPNTTKMQVEGQTYFVPNDQVESVKKLGGQVVGFSPAGNALASGVVPASYSFGSHLAQVNNNPGNLRYVGQPGATTGTGGFAKFASPEAGIKALAAQVQLDASRGHTLASFIAKYAPPSENDTGTYLKQLSTQLGVTPSTKISQIDIKSLVKAIAKKESSSNIQFS